MICVKIAHVKNRIHIYKSAIFARSASSSISSPSTFRSLSFFPSPALLFPFLLLFLDRVLDNESVGFGQWCQIVHGIVLGNNHCLFDHLLGDRSHLHLLVLILVNVAIDFLQLWILSGRGNGLLDIPDLIDLVLSDSVVWSYLDNGRKGPELFLFLLVGVLEDGQFGFVLFEHSR